SRADRSQSRWLHRRAPHPRGADLPVDVHLWLLAPIDESLERNRAKHAPRHDALMEGASFIQAPLSKTDEQEAAAGSDAIERFRVRHVQLVYFVRRRALD